ncbi:MAG: alpha/beta fold hydrolase [Geminicoccaceae bacterium]|nr:MAG: alpha/beta fold hydrolase [Geminicoccaceae bacterium]
MYCRSERPDWETDGRDWPNREASRFVTVQGATWHVQDMGEGPVLLLVHGVGAATHSWRDLAPLLAKHFRVVAMDLPGHGFSAPVPFFRLSLEAMAEGIVALLQALDAAPSLVIGHSAGAAILARMCIDGRIRPKLFVSLNGAFIPFGGPLGPIASPLAKLLFVNPLVPRFFAWQTDRKAAERLIGGTGSKLSPEGVELYARLARRPAHFGAALGMMASWNLRGLEEQLPLLEAPLVLVVGQEDAAIDPKEAERIQRAMPAARLVRLEGLGHLAHEEDPGRVAALIDDLWSDA